MGEVSNNPLAGLSVPSATELADRAVAMLGTGQLDLSNRLWRQRLKNVLERVLECAMRDLQGVLLQGQEKAIRHVFALMEDADYQNARAKRQKASLMRRKELAKQREDERAARRRERIAIAVVQGDKVVIQ